MLADRYRSGDMIVRPYSIQGFSDEHDAAMSAIDGRLRKNAPGSPRRRYEIAPWTAITILGDLAPLVRLPGHRFVRVVTPCHLVPMYVMLSDA